MERGMHYAYVGNVPGHEGNNTCCPSCSEICVRRAGFFITEMNIADGRCTNCKTEIAGVWQ